MVRVRDDGGYNRGESDGVNYKNTKSSILVQ